MIGPELLQLAKWLSGHVRSGITFAFVSPVCLGTSDFLNERADKSQSHGTPTVDLELDAGDELRFVRHQKHGAIGDIPWSAQPPPRDGGDKCSPILLCVGLTHERL